MNEDKYKIFEIGSENGALKDYAIINLNNKILYDISANLYDVYYIQVDDLGAWEGKDDTRIILGSLEVYGKYISYKDMNQDALLIYRKQLRLEEIIINL